MQQTQCSIKKFTPYGFTLIELSIVLVIISLIVGGILGGKSLIKSAALHAQISEVNSLLTTFNAYELQYDATPGDMRDAEDYFPTSGDHAVENGDGDGIIDGNGTPEPRNVWTMLYNAELLYFLEYPWRSTSLSTNTYQEGGEYRWYYSDNFQGKSGNRMQWGKGDAIDSIITPAEALRFDKKMDDGEMFKGNVFINNGRDVGGSWGCRSQAKWNSDGINAVDLTRDEVLCVLYFWR